MAQLMGYGTVERRLDKSKGGITMSGVARDKDETERKKETASVELF